MMNQLKIKHNSGASLMEYAIYSMLILSAMFLMKDTLLQGIFAKYHQSQDSLSFGRQFDAKRTTVCRQDVLSYDENGKPQMGPYYDEDCYVARVSRPVIFTGTAYDVLQGGCPTCAAGAGIDAVSCIACENEIKNQCAVESAYCTK